MQKHSPVISMDEIPWRDAKGLPGMIGSAFHEKILVHDSEYTSAYSISLAKFAAGAQAKRHVEKWNHTILVLAGSGEIEIDGTVYPIHEGSVITVKAGLWHGVANTGTEEMTMLVVYDPPRPSEH